MNAKLLYAATIALSLASTLAMADETDRPLTRQEVVAQLHQAAADGTLRKSDYDFDAHDFANQHESRGQVVAELQAARALPALQGPLHDGSYNPFGRSVLLKSNVARADVKADLREAIATGTLQRTDYDDDQALVARRANEHQAAKPIFARLRAAFSHNS
ncbi:MAG: DUF4148 domain-containing protein [Proteobacteria bacterium]|nr:DUF4148 domain-containing protein [Pseudomonadota bacterium]